MSTPAGESLRDRLTKATLLISIIALLSRVLGYARDAVIAYKYGVNDTSGAYYAAIQVPDLLNYLVAGGTLSATFVPLFREYWQRQRQSAAWTFFAVVSSLMLVIIVALVVGFEIFTRPIIVLYVGQGRPGWWIDLVTRITRIILPAQIFFVVGGLINGVIYGVRGDDKWYMAVPTIGSVIYNVAIIVGGLALSSRLGIEAFVWGGLVGAFVGPFLLVSLAARSAGARYRFRLNLSHPGVRRYLVLTLPLMIGVQYSYVDQILATHFAPSESAITILRQAYRLMQVPVGVFGLAAATATIGTLAALAADSDIRGFRQQIRQGLTRVGVISFPCTVLMLVLAPSLVQILLQRGHFRPEDTPHVASVLRWYSLGLYAWAANYVLARGMYSLQATWLHAGLGTATTLLMIPLMWLLVKPMGADGLALATTIGISLQTLLVFLALRTKLRGLHLPALRRSLARMFAASAAMYGVCWVVERGMHHALAAAGTYLLREMSLPGWLGWLHRGLAAIGGHLGPASAAGAFLTIVIVSGIGFLAFAGAAVALGEEEAAYLWSKVGGRIMRFRKAR